jgi:hypothetical protein
MRVLIVFLIMMGLFRYGMAQEVTAKMNIPGATTAGESVEVSIEINKGDLTNFGRIQQTFPAAVRIEPIEMSGADFSYTEGKLNIIWLNLPASPVVRLKYKLTTGAQQQGELSVGGKFSYIMANDRREITLGPKTMNIRPSAGSVAAGERTEQSIGDPATAIKNAGAFGIAAFREDSYLSEDSDGWVVNVLVSRGDVEKLARVEETIPPGFAAEQIDGKGSIFTFKGGIAKFLWMKLPADAYFMVSYKVIPTSGTSVQVPDVEGVFSYMRNDEVRSVTIQDTDDPLHTMGTSQLSAFLSGQKKTGGETAVLTSVPAETTPTRTTSTPQTQPVSVPMTTTVIKSSVPERDGLVFRVQLLATSNPSQARDYFRDFDLGEVYTEQHQGLYKYTTGNFRRIEDASAHSRKIASETGIKGFVTAYYDNQRITLDEARRIRDRQ